MQNHYLSPLEIRVIPLILQLIVKGGKRQLHQKETEEEFIHFFVALLNELETFKA
jgi:hypothetical protein